MSTSAKDGGRVWCYTPMVLGHTIQPWASLGRLATVLPSIRFGKEGSTAGSPKEGKHFQQVIHTGGAIAIYIRWTRTLPCGESTGAVVEQCFGVVVGRYRVFAAATSLYVT